MSSIEIIPTIVPDAFADIRDVSERYAGFATFFQIDVADGKFAANTTWLPSGQENLPQEYGYEVHLMVADPHPIGTMFAHAGAHALIAHLETLDDVEKARHMFAEWRSAGVRSLGVAMLLQTPLEKVDPYLPYVDLVLLMTIARIGVQGIPFDSSAPARVSEFHRRYPNVTIAVDGGVSEKTIQQLAAAGASRFGVGSAIAKAVDPAASYASLKTLAESATL